MLATLYFVLSLGLVATTAGVFFPRLYGHALQPVAALPSMVLSLFVPQFILAGVVLTVLVGWAGALGQPLGQLGLLLHLLCWGLLLHYLMRMAQVYPLLDGRIVRDEDHPFAPVLEEARRPPLAPAGVSLAPSLLLRIPQAAVVDVVRDIVYRELDGVRLRLDVYLPRQRAGALPAALYIHGGGWIAGTRRQSRLMLYELAAAGWVVFAISYRRAPRFPLPAAIEDCKAALVWIREHGLEYGTPGQEVVVLGGSAGGHLAAMLALTPNDPRFQRAFPTADTRVRGAVALYGLFDFETLLSQRPHRGAALFLERLVFQTRYRDDPERFRLAQPLSHLPPQVPPLLLVHGQNDGLVPIEQSRRLYHRLRQAGAQRVHLLEVPLALHAFEIAPTPLHQRTMRIILEFLETLRAP
ncbi:MAG: alpha/beta hydrolase [Myxococcales bacterium]|nr:alpha/beta hydrolase [Myxococcota bacterium]MDW8282997.1 alpha/beta hydrolase [Myxococcales bacterium]